MKLRLGHWVRVVLAVMVMMVSLVCSAPALAAPSTHLLKPSLVATTTPPTGSANTRPSNGSARDLLGRDGSPLSRSLPTTPRGLDPNQLNRVAGDINTNSGNSASIAQNRSPNPNQKAGTPDRLAVRVR